MSETCFSETTKSLRLNTCTGLAFSFPNDGHRVVSQKPQVFNVRVVIVILSHCWTWKAGQGTGRQRKVARIGHVVALYQGAGRIRPGQQLLLGPDKVSQLDRPDMQKHIEPSTNQQVHPNIALNHCEGSINEVCDLYLIPVLGAEGLVISALDIFVSAITSDGFDKHS